MRPKQQQQQSTSSNSTKDNANMDDEAAIEQLINKVCIKFVNQLESKFDSKFAELSDKLLEVSSSVKQINNAVNENKNSIEVLNNKVASLEQQLKKNALRFHGFCLEENENVPEMIAIYIKEKLKVLCTTQDIDYAFPVGKSDKPEKPPAILVNFTSNIKRNEVFAAKRLSKNTGIAIFEDLTKERHKLLMTAKNKFGNSQAWSSGGKVYVLRNNKKCILNSEKDM